jgi:hypothetical protein
VDALFRRPESVVDEHPANAITPANKEMPKSALLCLIIRPPFSFFGLVVERSIFFRITARFDPVNLGRCPIEINLCDFRRRIGRPGPAFGGPGVCG